MNPVDRTGSFRAEITEYGLSEMDSGSVSVKIKVRLLEMYDEGNKEWIPWAEYDMEAVGDVWVVGKGSKPNTKAIESLVRHAGWDGDFMSIAEERWHPTKCQVSIVQETYEGKTTIKVGFVNDYNRTPGAVGNVDPTKARDLASRFGPQFRAIAGTVRQNSVPTNGKPPTPPAPRSAPPAPRPLPRAVDTPDYKDPIPARMSEEEIPF